MNWKSHFMGGVLVTCLASFIIFYNGYLLLEPLNGIYLLAICFVFSLLPDIDIGTSIIRKVFTVIAGGLLIYAFIYHMNYLGIGIAALLIFIQFFHHRGMAHSIVTGLLLSASLYLYFGNFIFPIVAILNFMTHLALDM